MRVSTRFLMVGLLFALVYGPVLADDKAARVEAEAMALSIEVAKAKAVVPVTAAGELAAFDIFGTDPLIVGSTADIAAFDIFSDCLCSPQCECKPQCKCTAAAWAANHAKTPQVVIATPKSLKDYTLTYEGMVYRFTAPDQASADVIGAAILTAKPEKQAAPPACPTCPNGRCPATNVNSQAVPAATIQQAASNFRTVNGRCEIRVCNGGVCQWIQFPEAYFASGRTIDHFDAGSTTARTIRSAAELPPGFLSAECPSGTCGGSVCSMAGRPASSLLSPYSQLATGASQPSTASLGLRNGDEDPRWYCDTTGCHPLPAGVLNPRAIERNAAR